MTASLSSVANPLAEPFALPRGGVLRNRLAKAAMSEGLATADNRPTPLLVELYRRWGAAELGLIVTGNVMVDRRALGEPGNVVIEDATDLDLLRRWAWAATGQGAACWVQLNHPGKQATRGLNRETIAPSAVPFRADMQAMFATPREASAAEIAEIVRRFGVAARVCRDAGFSGVQIHGAHGYLVSQFLSPHHNRRTDDWGGTPEKRRRFVLAVLAEIRAQVGADFPVGIKLNSADFQRGGFEADESLETMAALADAGIDLIEISGGTYEAPAMTGKSRAVRDSTASREAYFLEFAERARATLSVPLMVTGGFRTAAGMNLALRSGALDLVGLARLLALDPEAPRRLLAGHDSPHRVRPIRTGLPMVDRLGIMEIFWYTLQLRRIGRGGQPRPREHGLLALAKAVSRNGWGTFRTRRART